MKLYDAQKERYEQNNKVQAMHNISTIPFVKSLKSHEIAIKNAGARNSSQHVLLRERAEQALATVAT